MSIRYAIQTKETNCVPVAVFNMLSWAGISLSATKDLAVMEGLMDTDANGTPLEYMFHFVEEFWDDYVSVKRMRTPTTDKIKREMKNGKSVFIDWKWDEKSQEGPIGHFFFISGFHKNKFAVHNITFSDKPTILMTEKQLCFFLGIDDFFGSGNAVYICEKRN